MDKNQKNDQTTQQLSVNNKLSNRQFIMMNNYNKNIITNKDFIIKNIYSNDDYIFEKIYNYIKNPYQKKINLINMILNSDLIIPLKTKYDIIKFFNWLSILNNEFNMSSYKWNYKEIKYGNKEKFLLQNSISKNNIGKNFYLNYIDLIKKKLTESNVNFCYFEFKSKRFNKIKDIIWSFDNK